MLVRMEWVPTFYERQGILAGLYTGDPDDYYRAQAARIKSLAPQARTVLELAAGGGQAAAAAADLGLGVTAIEMVDRAARNAERLAEDRPGMIVVYGDMYAVDLGEAHFDAVVYWDGFGTGEDKDQVNLLRRVHDWLTHEGLMLVDVYTPWCWAAVQGRELRYGDVRSLYGFDAYRCRMLNRWWDEKDGAGTAVEQSLRCYSPADLSMIAGLADLLVVGVTPHGAMDYDTGSYLPPVPLESAMSYTATLART